MVDALRRAGMPAYQPDGAYFVLADTSSVSARMPKGTKLDDRPDYNVCKWLTSEIRVAAIPPSAFYSSAHRSMADNLARFCFCKTEDQLQLAAERLARLSVE